MKTGRLPKRRFIRAARMYLEDCPFKMVRTNGGDEVLGRAANLLRSCGGEGEYVCLLR